MADIQQWVAGFVYRMRAPWETAPPAYHVEIGEYVEVPGRAPVILGEPMPVTPTRAEAMGFTLPAILADLRDPLLPELELAKGDLADVMIERDAWSENAEREAAAARGLADVDATAAAARTGFDAERKAAQDDRAVILKLNAGLVEQVFNLRKQLDQVTTENENLRAVLLAKDHADEQAST
jgi:hypothetical protein